MDWHGDVRQRPLTWVKEGSCIRCTSHALDNDGYPRMKRNGKKKGVARWILIRRFRDISTKVISRHTCDNAWCIRPDHIISGTPADNMRDRKERGGYANQHGENASRSKLTSLQVRQIRESTEPQKQIAKRFGICISNVSQIKNRRTWNQLKW